MSTEQRFLTDKEVAERYGVHRTWPWRKARQGEFPQPVRLSRNTSRWRLKDLEAWESGEGVGQ